MSISANLILLAQALGADVKALTAAQGDLASLPTTNKTSLAAALAEIHGLVQAGGAQIDDAAGNGDVDVVWSADKVFDSIEAAKTAVKNELLDGAGGAYDTFKELQDLLVGQDDAVAALTALIGNAVRFDQPQVLTPEQRDFALGNIGAASNVELAALSGQVNAIDQAIGDADADLVAAYNAAKAAE
ncbi:hypothetical protein D3C79_48750 [compost metagenome]